ncbi:FecR family protein [Mucilaginibacter sp. SG564]|uniref:FecR family protein n=1 Tax=Mucilaginibacter sp. SG564 TaxID=2587022 RepID=UPI001552D197|nr:FecR family protein [Mucilaginibacter sp. SG564]NOW96057.1 hypothetical protein [Mucilaginibacter sp. SG564]
MNKEQILALLSKYASGECTEEEKVLLEHWFYIQNSTDLPSIEEINADLDDVWSGLQQEPVSMRLWPRFAAAASIILFLSFGAYVITRKAKPESNREAKNQIITPGHNQATLSLANGKKIILTKGLSGRLAIQGKTNIIASQGNISYAGSADEKSVSYNTMSTSKGQQSPYPLVLADGTKVWLNADSKLTFPTAFISRERNVKLKGEGYFEVAKDPKHPFIVTTDKQEVKVLGTHFNICSYDDDPATITTLIEGSVEITEKKNEREGILKPGQQSILSSNQMKIREADVDEAIAWKDGYFMFESGDIESIMRKVARWYDIEVVYEGPIPQTKFYLSADRFSSISSLLKPLESSKRIHFKIEGRRITISK